MGVGKRGNSKFWYIQFQLGGRTFIKSSKTTDRKLAEMMEYDWRKQLLQQQVLGTRDRISVNEALDLYCQSKQDLVSYKNIVHHVKTLINELQGHRFLDELTFNELERLKSEKQRAGYANQTIKHIIAVIRGTWKYAKKMGYQVGNLEFPTVKIDKGRLRYLTFDEEKQLLAAIDPKRNVKGLPPYWERTPLMKREMDDLYDFIVLLLDTGARYTEIASLEWNNIAFDDRAISLWRSKVKNESVLFMTNRVYDILVRRHSCKTNNFIFTNRAGIARGYVASTIRKAFNRAGLSNCSAHTLRHTHATRLIQNGFNLYEVKEILGHSDIRTTMRYAHLEQRSVSEKACELIDRLNKENGNFNKGQQP